MPYSYDTEIENFLSVILTDPKDRTLVQAPKLAAFWNTKDVKWDCKNETDPLSLYLITKVTERERQSIDDEAIATLCVALGRRPDWVRSFIFGWNGLKNESTSINGFLLGDKLRRTFIK